MANSQVLGEMIVKITADVENLKKGLSDAQSKLEETRKKSRQSVDGMIKGFQDLGLLGGIGFAALIAGLKECVNAAAESELITAKLNQTIKATGGIAGITTEAAIELAESLKQITAFDDEAIISGETLLLTFTNIGKDVFPKATEAMLDLAATGRDMSGVAFDLGMALNQPAEAARKLRGMGIQLTQTQQEQINSFVRVNNAAGAQGVILDALSAKYGGQAKVAAQTFSGQMAQLKIAFDDIQKAIGRELIPQLSPLLTFFKDFGPYIEKAVGPLMQIGNYMTKLLNPLRGLLDVYDKAKNTLKLIKDNNLSALDIAKGTLAAFNPFSSTPLMAQETTSKKSVETTPQSQNKFTPNLNQGSNDDYKKILEERENIQKDFAKKAFLIDADKYAQLGIEESNYINKVKGDEESITNIKKYYSDQRKKLDSEEFQNRLQFASQTVGQISDLFAQYANNKNMELDNEKQKETEKINTRYEAEKAVIEATEKDETKKNAKLKALDEKKARDEKTLDEKIAKERRKIAYDLAVEQKIANIASAIMNTAIGVTAAFSAGPIAGPIMAAIIGALGAAQVALIAAQPLPALAEGGIFNGPALIGEAGTEAAIPLEGNAGKNAFALMADAILTNMQMRVGSNPTIENQTNVSNSNNGNVYLDGNLVGEWISNGSRSGLFTIDNRVIIK